MAFQSVPALPKTIFVHWPAETQMEEPLITDAFLTEQVLPVLLVALMCYMVFIVYDLGKKSNAGKWGMFVLFLGLMVGVLGFASKFIIKYFMNV